MPEQETSKVPSAEQITEMYRKIEQNQKEMKRFEADLKKLISGDKKLASSPLIVGKTPASLAICGADETLDMTITKKVIDKIMSPELRDSNGQRLRKSGHFLSESQLVNSIENLKNPLMVLKGSKDNSLVAITDIQDDKGQQILVSVSLSDSGSVDDVNKITSAYGKTEFASYLHRQINEEHSILAYNKEKANELLLSIGVDFPEANTTISFDNSIAYTKANVKYSNAKKHNTKEETIMPEQVNDKKYGITINKKLVVAENEYEVKTRIPFTYGENERHLNFKKEDVKEIHNGKTLLTSLTDNKNYMIYDKNDKVVGNMLGKELYSLHYDRLPGLYSFPKEYTQDNVVKDEHIQEEHIQEEQVQHEQQKNEQPQQKQTKQEAVQDEQVKNKPLSKRDTVSTDNEPYRPKITALANIYDSTNLKIAKQQDKIEILQSKNEKSNAKIQKATHFVDMCNVLLESKALPTPVLNLVDMLAENKKNKINTLEDKIKARNGKIAKANRKITKAEKKISSLRKIDSFINNLSSSEGRKDILVNGMVDFATYSKSNAEAKLENVNSKMAEVQALKDYTHFRADKIKYSNKLDKLSTKKEKLENKIKACENLFDKASTVVEKLNDIQTKMLCDNITTNVISTATTTPEQVSLDTVVDACNKSIAEMPVNERVSEEKNNPDNYLKNTEMAVEGNYDMIDGIINNEPPKREEKQESKQTFSLGINNLKKSAKRISEKKPENTNRDKAKGKDENSI